MLEKLKSAIVGLTVTAEKRQTSQDFRRLVTRAAKSMRSGALLSDLEGVSKIAEFFEKETGSWISAETLRDGGSGPFDACDLRHWLTLAERSGVPAVPAVEILRLSEDELGLLSGSLRLPDTAMTRGLRKGLAGIVGNISPDLPASDSIDPEQLEERLFSVMDDLPDDWMVRSVRCGGSELKALAGCGLSGPTTPKARFGPDVEVGPGWVRVGNRRRVNTSDSRTVTALAQGPSDSGVFVARPWIESARYLACEDPHRHGTPFAGKGAWPAEWRAFIVDGQVTGVSWYYGWSGEATAENAAIAIEVRDLAQRIADEAVALSALPRYMDVEFARNSPQASEPEAAALLEKFGRDKVAFTLDFIETNEGLMVLEGGPACSPFGGGHPCAFAGFRPNGRMEPLGVAFKTMPGVLIADPATWSGADPEGCIFAWDEVYGMAAAPSP